MSRHGSLWRLFYLSKLRVEASELSARFVDSYKIEIGLRHANITRANYQRRFSYWHRYS